MHWIYGVPEQENLLFFTVLVSSRVVVGRARLACGKMTRSRLLRLSQ